MKFLRQDYFKFKRLKRVWRKPKGRHSKLRVRKKGSGIRPSIGYKTGKKDVELIRNVNDLNKTKTGIIASTVGAKKRKIILERAKEFNVKILNMNAKKVKK